MTEEKVLILHGWEDDSKKGFIPELVKTLTDKGYSSIAVDLPNTDTPKFEEWLDFTNDEIKKINDENLNIVGHSMGGLLALKLAEKYKLNRLVLVAPLGSKPSKEYFDSIEKDLTKEELEIYKKYQDRDINIKKIKENVKKVVFVFGKKDPWVNEEIRNFYSTKFKDVAEIKVFDNYAHMSETEGVKKLEEVENLFETKKQQESKKEEQKREVEIKVEETTQKQELKVEAQEKPKEAVQKVAEKYFLKKNEAMARGRSIPVSKRQCMYISSFIKNKKIDEAILDLEKVIKFKKAVPFKGEIPHRKGMMSGRYPIKASKIFIKILRGLKGNALVNGLDLEKTKITLASANWASRPRRREGTTAKRTHVLIKATEVEQLGEEI